MVEQPKMCNTHNSVANCIRYQKMFRIVNYLISNEMSSMSKKIYFKILKSIDVLLFHKFYSQKQIICPGQRQEGTSSTTFFFDQKLQSDKNLFLKPSMTHFFNFDGCDVRQPTVFHGNIFNSAEEGGNMPDVAVANKRQNPEHACVYPKPTPNPNMTPFHVSQDQS